MIDDPLRLFVVEYSMTQNSTHVHTLRAMLANNLKNLSQGTVSDYVPIRLFKSREDAERFDIAIRPTLDHEFQLHFRSRNWKHISSVLTTLQQNHFNTGTDDPQAPQP